jgi:hypothetical protein
MRINRRAALNALRQCVDERGGFYVYESTVCRNWERDTDQPGCIVGLALFKLGVPRAFLKDESHETMSIRALVPYLKGTGITLSKPAIRAFWIAQILQDRRATWGDAVVAARVAASDL